MVEKHGVEIRVRNVSKTFGPERRVFDAIDLQISSGEFVCIVGASGCGKSTLLRMIAGLEPTDSGKVEYSPEPKTAFVFQDAQLLPWRTVDRNVELPLELSGMEKNERSARARAALARVGLPREGGLFPAQLSGGMKMRVSLARALATDPSLLLLDEPFAALDELSRIQLEEELRSLCAGSGMTVVFVTHSFSEAVFLSDRILILDSQSKGVGEILAVPFSDRTPHLRSTAQFSELVGECRRKFEALQGGRS